MNWDVIGQLLGDGLLAAVAAIGFAVISNPPRKAIFISALLAAVGHALRFYLIRYTPLDIAMASLVAAFTIGMFSMLFAKLIHCPAVIFSFPSLLPMVPGMYAYKTVLALMQFIGGGDVTRQNELMVEFFRNGLTTLFIMFALVIGVALPVFIFHKQSFMMTRLLKNQTEAPAARLQTINPALKSGIYSFRGILFADYSSATHIRPTTTIRPTAAPGSPRSGRPAPSYRPSSIRIYRGNSFRP